MTPEAEAAHREPRTEAGKRMLHDWQLRRTHPPTAARQESYRQFILAIEAEAIAAYRADLIEKVRAEDEPTVLYEDGVPVAKFPGLISRAAVLRLLEAEPLDPEGKKP